LSFQIVNTKAESAVLAAKRVQAVLVGVDVGEIRSSFRTPREHVPQHRRFNSGRAPRVEQLKPVQKRLDGMAHGNPLSSRLSSTSAQFILFL
jgi:hypothetical protein